MKILHIGQLIGGLDIYIRNSITYANENIEFVIIHGKGDNNKPIIRKGEMVKEYSIDLYRNLNLWNDLKCLVQAIKIVRKEKPSVIHCHSAKGGFIGRIAGFITKTKTFYTPHAFSFLSTPNKIKRYIYLTLERIARLDSYLLACSDSEGKLGITSVKYKKNKTYIWNNAVPRPVGINYNNDIQSPYICYIGRPSYQKNTLFLIDVINEVHKEYPNIHFLLLGVGYYSPELNSVEQKIKEYGIEDVITLKPWLSHSDTMGYVQNSLFYLSTAKYEGLPLAIIEAMAMKKAIVASDVPGNKDCVKNDYNGYLISLDLELFKNKIITMIRHERERSKFEDNSLNYFESQFNIENRIKMLENIYLDR